MEQQGLTEQAVSTKCYKNFLGIVHILLICMKNISSTASCRGLNFLLQTIPIDNFNNVDLNHILDKNFSYLMKSF